MNRSWTDRSRNPVDDYDDTELDLTASFDADFDDEDIDAPFEANEIRPATSRSVAAPGNRTAQRSSSRLLPHDWADFDYGGADDGFDSNWR